MSAYYQQDPNDHNCIEHSRQIAALQANERTSEKRMDRIEGKIDGISTNLSNLNTKVEGIGVRVMVGATLATLLGSSLIGFLFTKLPLLVAMAGK